jgi:hypothetical protein
VVPAFYVKTILLPVFFGAAKKCLSAISQGNNRGILFKIFVLSVLCQIQEFIVQNAGKTFR